MIHVHLTLLLWASFALGYWAALIVAKFRQPKLKQQDIVIRTQEGADVREIARQIRRDLRRGISKL